MEGGQAGVHGTLALKAVEVDKVLAGGHAMVHGMVADIVVANPASLSHAITRCDVQVKLIYKCRLI